MRVALTTALKQLRDSAERVPALDEAPVSRVWILFLLAHSFTKQSAEFVPSSTARLPSQRLCGLRSAAERQG